MLTATSTGHAVCTCILHSQVNPRQSPSIVPKPPGWYAGVYATKYAAKWLCISIQGCLARLRAFAVKQGCTVSIMESLQDRLLLLSNANANKNAVILKNPIPPIDTRLNPGSSPPKNTRRHLLLVVKCSLLPCTPNGHVAVLGPSCMSCARPAPSTPLSCQLHHLTHHPMRTSTCCKPPVVCQKSARMRTFPLHVCPYAWQRGDAVCCCAKLLTINGAVVCLSVSGKVFGVLFVAAPGCICCCARQPGALALSAGAAASLHWPR